MPEPGRLRVAYLGPEPVRGGGVAGCAWLIIQELATSGCKLDCFLQATPDDPPHGMTEDGVRVVNVDTGWRWGRWYSRNSTIAFATGLAARAWGRRRLARLLLERHASEPYDVVYQFSTIEVFGLRRFAKRLPPLVLHPSVHIAGELAGFRRERSLAARCEPRWRRVLIELFLRTRVRRQRRDISLASTVIAISRTFADHLIRDYGLARERVTVVPYPIDLTEIAPKPPPHDSGVRRVSMVSRMSVRKGVDQAIDLSHRLEDLAGSVRIEIVGDHTLWSDYRPLLAELNGAVATYRGPLSHADVVVALQNTDVLIHPATYEPFGLAVGEAFACGVPVVATDEVGAAENVSPECCVIVPAGDTDALERAVREMLVRLASDDGSAMRATARAEAERLFAPERIGMLVRNELTDAARRRMSTRS